jgi:hypothetical protein
MGEGTQSGEHRCAARAERELEQMRTQPGCELDLKEMKMPDFTAKADIYRVEFKSSAGHRPIAPSKPIRSGTVAECVRWIMAKRPDDRKTYFMTVALEAGFLKGELRYRDIEDIARRVDFLQT